MNQVEYTALTSMISTLKHQIAAVETLLATIANAKLEKTRPVTRSSAPADVYLTADEDRAVAQDIEAFRQAELRRLEGKAEEYFAQKMQDAVDGTSDQGTT